MSNHPDPFTHDPKRTPRAMALGILLVFVVWAAIILAAATIADGQFPVRL